MKKVPLTSRELALLEIMAQAVLSGRGRLNSNSPAEVAEDQKLYRMRLLRCLRYHGKGRQSWAESAGAASDGEGKAGQNSGRRISPRPGSSGSEDGGA